MIFKREIGSWHETGCHLIILHILSWSWKNELKISSCIQLRRIYTSEFDMRKYFNILHMLPHICWSWKMNHVVVSGFIWWGSRQMNFTLKRAGNLNEQLWNKEVMTNDDFMILVLNKSPEENDKTLVGLENCLTVTRPKALNLSYSGNTS